MLINVSYLSVMDDKHDSKPYLMYNFIHFGEETIDATFILYSFLESLTSIQTPNHCLYFNTMNLT